MSTASVRPQGGEYMVVIERDGLEFGCGHRHRTTQTAWSCAAKYDSEEHRRMAELCTCGMAEQEHSGHYPEHAEWCDVPSPLEPEDDVPPPSPRGDAEGVDRG